MTLRLAPSVPGAIDERIQRRIVAALRERGAVGIEINLEVLDEIPVAATGKRRFVISTVVKKAALYTAIGA